MSTETTDPAEVEAAERQARRDAIIQPLIKSVTQREKFLLADRLAKPYSELMEDPDRILTALAWVKLKRDAGGVAPDFEQLLDMTDEQVLTVLGLDDLEDDEEAVEQGKAE